MKLEELKKHAREHDMIIRKYERGEDSYILVDARLDDLDRDTDE